MLGNRQKQPGTGSGAKHNADNLNITVTPLPILAGLAAGAIHVFTGPDHLAAVAPLSLTRQGRTWLVGLRWGLGHSTGVILVAIAAYFLRDAILNTTAFTWSERLVGLTIIAIGLWGLRRSYKTRIHTHSHTHDGHSHQHTHVHPPANTHEAPKPKPHFHTHTALLVGTLHGLGGGAHVIGVLPTLAMPTKLAAGTYLAAFALGTIIAMITFSSIMDLLASKTTLHGPSAYRALTTTFAIIAIVIGAYWLCAPTIATH
jgi:ABC-type nickel/cobalt efflux system permease component RcnA